MVLVGAEAVVENGGVINKLGSYQVRAIRSLVQPAECVCCWACACTLCAPPFLAITGAAASSLSVSARRPVQASSVRTHTQHAPASQIAICAKALNKPVYVAAESYKFARLYPLTQKVCRQAALSQLGPSQHPRPLPLSCALHTPCCVTHS